ncbi:peptide ABC transporter substrate-binding protein [Bacillus canaveralius]|uniref:Peptide ABC transporter substrate-binding protein n=1 Tax=Bacillus canaveralius TaxID=1403243 RepID=A0A2N5GSF0_9BACI|nr:dipeptide ABC transporter ATP-binding protein [Bacillus canaveralius]PLR86572.1 peptide ABC transporter substrate-binding protein [Bacillus canaveralius]PLS00343.1 peptide ABC transporter substrate-binding protein [Bacillus canaveralius]
MNHTRKEQAFDNSEPLLRIVNLKKHFTIKGGGLFNKSHRVVQAVDDVSFEIYKGETLGLVGESGCGKSTLGRNILQLQKPTGGEVFFKDKNILTCTKQELRKLRKQMQIIYQDPFGSLNPRFTIGQIIGEMYEIHGIATGDEKEKRVKEMLELVGLDSSRYNSYPHEFSGGQRQRVGIARALALNPEFVVADEPVSALDVSVQSQIINLLMKLKKELGLTLLFIAHGLNVVRHISDRVGVMYLGKLVELAGTDDIFESPAHPYTAALLSTVPEADPRNKKERIVLTGEVPSPASPPSGCRFRTRCPLATERCAIEQPQLVEIRNSHFVSCHYPLERGQSLKEAIMSKSNEQEKISI